VSLAQQSPDFRALDYVPILFFRSSMTTWTHDDVLRLTIVMGLRDGLRLIRGMRRALTEDEQHKIAHAIAKHLQKNNRKIERGPGLEGHGQYLIPP
jgi:hypothetical protein